MLDGMVSIFGLLLSSQTKFFNSFCFASVINTNIIMYNYLLALHICVESQEILRSLTQALSFLEEPVVSLY